MFGCCQKKKQEQEQPGFADRAKKRMEEFWKENKLFLFLRLVLVFFCITLILDGGTIIILSIVSYGMYPQISALITRLITAGASLIVEGLFGMLCSSLYFCFSTNISCLLRTFLASFSVGFECLIFGIIYLGFSQNWIQTVLLNGNKSYIFKVDYDKINNEGGSIDQELDKHFVVIKIAAVFCIIGFGLLFITTLLSGILITPRGFMDKTPRIVVQISAVVASEFIFFGSWFTAVERFSNVLLPNLVAYITIGSIIDVVLSVMGVIKICMCGILMSIWLWARRIIIIIIALTCFITAIIIFASSNYTESSARETIENDCIVNGVLLGMIRPEDVVHSKVWQGSSSFYSSPSSPSFPSSYLLLNQEEELESQDEEMEEERREWEEVLRREEKEEGVVERRKVRNDTIALQKRYMLQIPWYCVRTANNLWESYGCSKSGIDHGNHCDPNKMYLDAVDSMLIVSKGYSFMAAITCIVIFIFAIVGFFISVGGGYLSELWYGSEEGEVQKSADGDREEGKKEEENKKEEIEMKDEREREEEGADKSGDEGLSSSVGSKKKKKKKKKVENQE